VDKRVTDRLLSWFDKEKRALPWRKSRDPYAIWVSEIMLQQTTVAVVAARYEAFLARFPDLAALARSRPDAVLAAWSGLGYYQRARNLHRAARQIVRQRGGAIPESLEELKTLPGVGEYTANALRAVAFGQFALPMDANIRRVTSRLFATRAPRSFLPRLVSRERPGDCVAALFDLGQLLCRPRNPDCPNCPLRSDCRAARTGRASDFPPRPARKARRVIHLAAAVFLRNGRYFLRRRRSSWLSGLWEFPAAEGPSAREARRRLMALVGDLGRRLPVEIRHAVVNRNLRISIYPGKGSAAVSQGRWMTRRALEGSAVSSLVKKIAGALPQEW
jgi:A/G-specific adenine glycosylase